MYMSKRSIRNFGISAASFSLALSLLFPSASYASPDSFLPPSPDLRNQTSLLQSRLEAQADSLKAAVPGRSSAALSPRNYAGSSSSPEPVTVIVQLQSEPVKVAESQAAHSKGFSPPCSAIFSVPSITPSGPLPPALEQ